MAKFGGNSAAQPTPAVYEKRQGMYFNYINTSDIFDLTRYQIGSNETEHIALNHEHCFIYALRQSGRYTEQQLDAIKLQLGAAKSLLSLAKLKDIKGLGSIRIIQRDEITNLTHL